MRERYKKGKKITAVSKLHSQPREVTEVAFQGERGAYSEVAALKFFGEKIQTFPYRDLKDVILAVEKNRAHFGILPVENSIEGSIGQTYDLLLKSNLKITGEEILRISHCLISNKKTSLKSIKQVFSHPQALGQCRKFLEKLKCEIIPTYDTAGSVKMIKEKKIRNSAAIASERAARIYGMKILKKGIETNKKNFTRFFIISKKTATKTGKDKTSVVFSTKHVPGALFKALEGFAKNKINLTKIESRPIPGKPWEYHFYLDFEGNVGKKRVLHALTILKKVSLFMRILGSYPQSKNAL